MLKLGALNKGGYRLFRAQQHHTRKPQIFIQNHRFKMEKPAETWLKLYVVDLGFGVFNARMVPIEMLPK